MTFSAWMTVQAYGYSGTAPYAVFTSGYQRYHPTWQNTQWRYDRATGYVEYRGLAINTVAQPAAQTNAPMILTYLTPSPGLPKPTVQTIVRGMSNSGDRSYGQPFRFDIANHATAHHSVNVHGGSVLVPVNTWFWLELNHSFSNADPMWYPWRNISSGPADGVTATFGSGWSEYNAGWARDFRFTRDYKRWQWRALLTGPSLGAVPPYDNIVIVAHPSPQTLGNCLNVSVVNKDWAGGPMQGMRVDTRQQAGGHRIDIVSATAGTVPGYFAMTLDYCTNL